MEFYFHYIDTPVSVAGLETKYLMNTTQSFRFPTQQEAHANSLYKPLGLPKIVVNFYLYPNLAGPVIIDGTWQVLIWINGSAYHPTTFSLQFKEITVGGVEVWDSGQINPTVTSTIDEYIDVPLHSYNLSTPLTHTFSVDTTLLVSVEINPSSAADARIWYDSPLYPSRAILPCQDYARPASVKTYAYDDSETNLFHYNWTQSQRMVTVQANVTDPFGGYDVNSVNITILDPSNNAIVDNQEMTRISNGQWETGFSQVFEANWSYPETAERGNYTVKVTVIDNNGYYRYLDTGFFEPFIEFYIHVFTIGVIVYYNPVFQIVDDVGSPLATAQVYITWPNGSRDVLPRFTSTKGYVNLTHVLPANYGFTILWKDAVVNQTIINVESDGPYTIKTEVYELTVNVQGNSGANLHGAYVIIYTQEGVGYGLATTDEAGLSVFKLPKGTYNIEAHYSAEYWLNVITTSATESGVIVNSPTSKTIAITDFPPPVWITTGFWLLSALLAVSASVVIYLVFLRRGRIPKRAIKKK